MITEPGQGLAESSEAGMLAPADGWSFSPLHVIAGFASALALWYSAGPLRDFDSLWHVEVGAQIAAQHRVTDLPSPWLGVSAPGNWVTSQWLSELVMHAATAIGGWRALIAINVALMLGLLAGLAVMVLHRTPVAIAVPVFVIVLAGASGGIQERPQAVSLVLLPWLAIVCRRLQEGIGRPPLILVAAGSLVWAQFHGMWILAPIAFTIVGAGIIIDGPRPFGTAVRAARPALWCLLASMAGVVNPHGLGSFLLPFRFRTATALIMEWWPTTFTMSFTACWGLLLVVTFAAWARTRQAIPRSEILWVLVWTVFGVQSFRNVTPALLLIAPVSLAALIRAAGPRSLGVGTSTRPAESRVLAITMAIVIAGAALLAGARVRTVDPLRDVPGAPIAAWVAQQPRPLRIWNSWNTSGALAGLSDHKALLVVDGRADLWGQAYAKRLNDAEELRPGWQQTLNSFHPEAVVAERISGLFSALAEESWRVQVTDPKFALLLPPAGGLDLA